MSSAGRSDPAYPMVRWLLLLTAAVLGSMAVGFAVGLARPRAKSLSS